MIEVPNKIIINDIIVSLNTHIIDVLIAEVLTDSPLLIIKENINCGNFLNNVKFNFLTDIINYNFLTDFPINERLYGKVLFHMFLQNERYNITYRTNRITIDLVNILNSSHADTNRLYHDYSNTTATQQEYKGVQRKVCFIINAFLAFLIKHLKKTLQKDIDRKVFKINFTEALQENIYFQDHFSRHNPFPKTHLQTTTSKRTS